MSSSLSPQLLAKRRHQLYGPARCARYQTIQDLQREDHVQQSFRRGVLPVPSRETYDTIDRIRKKYGVAVEVVFPDAAEVEEMVNAKGVNLFYESVENRKLCCKVRKVHPINRMLATLDGWITGLRHEQTKLRHAATMVQLDAAHGGIVKINPIINWTWEDVQNYIKSHDVVYNELLDRGYLSIGCEPCTRPVKPGQSVRDGRWWWESGSDLECGIHVDPV